MREYVFSYEAIYFGEELDPDVELETLEVELIAETDLDAFNKLIEHCTSQDMHLRYILAYSWFPSREENECE